MTAGSTPVVRLEPGDDTSAAGRLLDEFNREYDEPTPGAEAMASRLAELMAGGDTAVLLGGDGPDGIAVLRFRPALWSPGLECYLAELFVRPAERGRGIGRALIEAAINEARRRGADGMDLSTGEEDAVAHALYRSLGFTDRESPGGPLMYFFEREL